MDAKILFQKVSKVGIDHAEVFSNKALGYKEYCFDLWRLVRLSVSQLGVWLEFLSDKHLVRQRQYLVWAISWKS